MKRIKLTHKNGSVVTIVVDHIAAWGQEPGGSERTEVFTSAGPFFVQESIEEIERLIEETR